MTRRIDHLVVAVRDLDRAAEFYRRLGFQVGARNRHPWGTENHVLQFDRSFVELIAVGEESAITPHAPGVFSFGAFVQDYLREREGLAMLVLDSQDAAADARRFAEQGIGAFQPLTFERQARRPDGSETRVAFTLAFARDEIAPRAGFFVCQQHFPEYFWDPAFQVHGNGAARIASVALSAPQPGRLTRFLSAFAGVEPSGGFGFPLEGGRIDLMTPDEADRVYGSVAVLPDEPNFVAFSVAIDGLDSQMRRLETTGIAHERIGSRIVVPPRAAFGVAIAFEAA